MSFIQYLEKCLCMDMDEGRGCDELNLHILKLCDSPELGSHYFHLEHLSFEPGNIDYPPSFRYLECKDESRCSFCSQSL